MAYKLGPERKLSVQDAISEAFGEIQSLRDETSDNASNTEGKPQGERWQEAADALDGCADNEPDVPAEVADFEVTVRDQVNTDKRRGPSRAVRLSNACGLLSAVKERLESLDEKETDDDEDLKDAAEQLASDLDEAIDLDGSVEFPTMFGG